MLCASITMAEVQSEDSADRWKYTTVITKFVINWIEMAISKSFGVLIPVMIIRLSTNTRTLGFVCSMPSAWMTTACPAVAYVMKMGVVKPRVIALIGAFLSSATLITAGFITSIPVLGICLSINGIGLSMGYLSAKVMLNEYFKRSYVLMAAVANLGTTSAFIAPFIIERSLEAYGYVGAMLVLAALTLHAIPASVTLREPRDSHSRSSFRKEKDGETAVLLADGMAGSKAKQTCLEDGNMEKSLSRNKSNSSPECLTNLREWVKSSVLIKEYIFTMTLPCTFFTAFCVNAWVLFLVPRAEWHGIPSSRAVFVSTVGGAGGIVGRVFFISLLYFGANPIILSCIFYMISAVTFLVDPLITTFAEMCTVAFIQGVCVFSSYLSLSSYIKYFVSDENFTIAAGIDGLMAGLGGVSGGYVAGLIKDTTQSFTTVFLLIGVVFCLLEINALLALLAYRRKVAEISE